MAKRSSEHQLTRDDDSDGEEEVKVGMVKADASVLAGRQIKGLPKRKGATPLSTSAAASNASSASATPGMPSFAGFGATPTSTETKPEAPRFAGFAGFGIPSSAPPTAPPAAPKPSEAPRFPSFAGFGTASTTSATKTDAQAESKPAEAPRFGGFTGFGLKSTTSTSTSSAITPKPEAPTPPAEPKSDTTAALTYWTSLRGLNHSFVENMKKTVEADMFADLSGAFKEYQEFREKIVKDYESAKKARETPGAAKSSESKPAFGFGAAPSASSSDSPFSFGSSKPSVPAANNTGALKPSSFGLSTSSSKPVGFGSTEPSLVTPAATPPVQPPSPHKPVTTFNISGGAPSEEPTPSPMPEGRASSIFDFGSKSAAPKPATSEENPFDVAAKASSGTMGAKPSFTFGSAASPFGTAGTTTKPDVKPFSFSTTNNTGFAGFGGSSAPTPALSTTATAGSSAPPSTKPFSFTTPLSTPGTPFAFGAGSPKGNTTPRPGGSVGFSFGSSPPKKDPPAFTFGASTSGVATPKSESGPSDEEKDKAKDRGENEGDKPAEEGDAADGEQIDRAQATGAGEENEDTVHSVRARVLRFYKKAWVGVGIGQFKIKYDRETHKRRVLHRLEATGRVVLNCNLFEEMDPVVEVKGLMRFTSIDEEGLPMLYRVKVKTEAEAEALTQAFKDAIEAYKAERDA